jgi:hypothetical protein
MCLSGQNLENDISESHSTGDSTSISVRPFAYVKYTIANVSGCTLASYDTKISEEEYMVMIVGSSFKTIPFVGLRSQVGGSYNAQSVYAYVQDGTWRLSASYPGGIPENGVNGTWILYCMLIRNTLVNKLPDKIINAGGDIRK